MSDPFSSIIGHQKQLDYLRQVLKKNSPAHAYCFYGPAHIGKFTIARALAAAFLGIDASALNAHPDAKIIDSDTRIGVDEIRELNKRLVMTSFFGGKKVAIINNAHTMLAPAQNALLKTLEEPRGLALIILVAQAQAALLPTIRSRSAEIMFSLQNGRPGIEIQAEQDAEFQAYLEDKIKSAAEFLALPIAGRLRWIEGQTKRKMEKSDIVLEFIELWRATLHGRFLQELSKPKERLLLLRSLQALAQTELVLAQNANPSFALQHFAISI